MTTQGSILLVLMTLEITMARSGYFASYLSANQNRQKPIYRSSQPKMKTENDGSLVQFGNLLVILKKEMMAMRTDVLELHEQSSAVWRKLQQLQDNQQEDEIILAKELRSNHKNKTAKGDRCLSGYKKDSDGFCFRLSGERVSWQTAFNNCKLDGAILVKVDTSKKQRFLTEIANKNEKTQQCDFWLGATKLPGDVGWKWQDDSQLSKGYTNWNPDEPNNSSGSEYCSQMLWLFSWRWNDLSCKGRRACYICQTQQF